MAIPATAVHVSRKYLKEAGYRLSGTSGRLDSRDKDALNSEIHRRLSELHPDYRDAIIRGSATRHLVAHVQLLAKDKDVHVGKVDGLWGVLTEEALEQLEHFEQYGALPAPWRDPVPVANPANVWPVENDAALIAFYGQPGTNLVTIDLPYVLRLDWELSTRVRRLTCHEKVADSLSSVLEKVQAHYGEQRIKELHLDRYGGCYNKRKKRGGTSWSMHAWAIALDFDTSRNKLRWGRDRAAFAKPEYNDWWRLWEEEGWTSLGRSRNFDWMHVQATRSD